MPSDERVHWLLLYELADDYLARRPTHRDAHLAYAQDACEKGLLVMAGALADPVDMAVLVFRAEDASPAEAFAARDPYVVHGLVVAWRVRRWRVVVGPEPEAR